jgi:phosphoribosyl-ATP pyrophosphohydrolase/phosphoribosyl-AMP cyclohydrolase
MLTYEETNLKKIKYDSQGLVPAIIQDIETNEVVMLAYMNAVSLKETLESGETCFFSRSRQKLWHKGESSGNCQKVISIVYDCDGDTLLIKVRLLGDKIACHEGDYSCFHYPLATSCEQEKTSQAFGEIIENLYRLILERKETLPEGSYTTYLFNKGLDKILKKVGEETAEVLIAAKNNSKEELVYEASDLLYHLTVLMVEQGISYEDLSQELKKRKK